MARRKRMVKYFILGKIPERELISCSALIREFNSHAVGMVVARPYGLEIAFGETLFL